MSIKDAISKATVATVVAGFLAISGMVYFMLTKNTDSVLFAAGAAIGWLFKEIKG